MSILKNFPKYALLLGDLLAIIIAFRAAYFLRYEAHLFPPSPEQPLFRAYGFPILLCLAAWILIFFLNGANDFAASNESALGFAHLITASALLIAILLGGMYLAKAFYSRLVLFVLSFMVVLLLLLTRVLYRFLLRRLRKYGLGMRRLVIVGQSPLATELAERLTRRLDLPYQLVGFLAPATGRAPSNEGCRGKNEGLTVSSSEAMARELDARNVQELIFAIPIRRDTETLEFIAHCQKLGITIKSVPEYYELHTSHIESINIDGIPILELKEASLRLPDQVLKRAMDLLLLTLSLPFTLPLTAGISVLIYLTGARVTRREARVGLGGEIFNLYRFDVTSAEGADPVPDEPWGLRYRRFLLKYSLSELPQLWNVLRGEMSMVGPRPETPERVRHYSAWHRRRLQLKPGITGLAQVKGLRGIDSSDSKTKYDLEYAANYTPLVDLALILATVSTLFARRDSKQSDEGPPPLLPLNRPLRNIHLANRPHA